MNYIKRFLKNLKYSDHIKISMHFKYYNQSCIYQTHTTFKKSTRIGIINYK